MKHKAVFFDRDDTLLIDTNYMHKVEDLKFLPGALETLKKVQELGYKIFIVTNQSGIGRGYFNEDQMHTFHKQLLKELSEHSISISDIAFCPHAPSDECDCRKPSPKLLNELCDKYHIDPKQSFMIGDKVSDVEAGLNANMAAIGINCKAPTTVTQISEILNYL